jgi:uncharacterized protein YecE (DUF72 family)
MNSSAKILVGTAGWAYNDWEGIFYPLGMQHRREHPLTYLAECFDMVEINASFYGYIKPEWAKVWSKRVDAVNPHFKFTAKMHNSFTHASRDMPGPTSAASINPTQENEKRARNGFDSLASIGKLGAVLAQFPFSYKNTPLNREYLAILARRFSEYPLAIEVRDESWDTPDTIRYLTELQLAFCNIDWFQLKQLCKVPSTQLQAWVMCACMAGTPRMTTFINLMKSKLGLKRSGKLPVTQTWLMS